MFSERDQRMMRRALTQAQLAAQAGEAPVGAVLVDAQYGLLAEAGNRCIRDHDPSAHAEMLAIRQAAKRLRNYRLPHSTLYVTLEPCAMCAAVCIHARIERIVFGAVDSKTGALVSKYALGSDQLLNHRLVVAGGLLAEECAELLHLFFKARRLRQSMT